MRRQKILLITTMVIISTMLSACWPMGSWDWSFSGSGNLSIEDANATSTVEAADEDASVTVDNPALATQFANSGVAVTFVASTPVPPASTPTAILSDPTPNVADWVIRSHSFEFAVHNRTSIAPTLVDPSSLAIEHGDYDSTITSGWSSGGTYVENCYDVKTFMASAFEIRGDATLVFVLHDSQQHNGQNVPDGTIIELEVEDGRFTIQDGKAQSLYNDSLTWICGDDATTAVFIWSEQGYRGSRGVYRYIPDRLEDFINIYYTLVDDGRTDETWGMLTDEFKARFNSSGYQPYTEWWSSVEWTKVSNITITSQDGNVKTAAITLQHKMHGEANPRNATTVTYQFILTTEGWKFHFMPAPTEAPTRRPAVIYPTATATRVHVDRHEGNGGSGDHHHATATAAPIPTNTVVIVPTATDVPPATSCTVTNVSWNYQDQDGEYRFEWTEGSDCASKYNGSAPLTTGGQIRYQERRPGGRNVVEITCGYNANGDGQRCDDEGATQIVSIVIDGTTYTAGQ